MANLLHLATSTTVNLSERPGDLKKSPEEKDGLTLEHEFVLNMLTTNKVEHVLTLKV